MDKPTPPTFEQVKAAGYSDEAAKAIVEMEEARAKHGVEPYGDLDPVFDEEGNITGGTPKGAPPAAGPGPTHRTELDSYASIRGRRRLSPRERRQLQGHLGGVKLVTVTTIQDESGKEIPPDTDITEQAKRMSNLPTLIRRGWVKATPGVDWSRIQVEPSSDPSSPPKFAESAEHVAEMSKLAPASDPQKPAELEKEQDPHTDEQEPAQEPAGEEQKKDPPASEDGPGNAQQEPGEEAEDGKGEEDPEAQLAKLSEKDSAKHVLAVVGRYVPLPEKCTKKQALELRDQFLARLKPQGEEAAQ